ncbi:methionine ABC transporter ATP-binding protein [Dysosmobacter sp.]|jgi:D-methionine transport system ATP-binding protein|uniref:methionine ABC transporter ATP-binding protein n=1 Tax=Dysosmobacter sp. TaxID=2591382 RepID=UPI003FD88127
MSEPIIQIQHLTKTFGSGEGAVTALEDINLDIQSGEIFGIIGLSGAGKSTLVRCINLLERPTSGSVVVNGKEMTSLTERELRQARRSVTMIFQGFNLLMQRTVLQNVCFPMEISGVSKQRQKERALELLELVGLQDKAGAYPAQLSGGQKQRVAIARALATDPKVLLCDEATSALDPTTTASILELLKDLNEKLGVTVVVITHQMSVIEEICSRVAIIADSHIVESGAVSEVFRHPKTSAARQLIIPGSEAARKFTGQGKVYRITFDGTTSDQPVVAGMVLACGEPVNIWFADTRDIDGKAYGHMLVQLPENEVTAGRMLSYLDEVGVTYKEESQDAYC